MTAPVPLPTATRAGATAALANVGAVVSVRGSVVDVRFDAHLPPIYSVLRAGAQREIVIEVREQVSASRVRGIALTPTQGLARGMAVEDTGGPLQAPSGSRSSGECSMCSATPSTISPRRRMFNGRAFIARRRR